jgi:hypothetical protein
MGNRLDMLARKYQQSHGVSYRDALNATMRSQPELAAAWDRGKPSEHHYAEMTPLELAMLRAQNDATWVKNEASRVLDHHAQAMAGGPRSSAGIAQVSPESYRDALQSLIRQFPDLGEAADTGRIDSDNWRLLATIDPNVATAIKQRFGVDPYNLRAGNYSRSHVYRDASNNEVRKYVL